MAIRNDFAPGEVLAAADLNDTFGSKWNAKIADSAPTSPAEGDVWVDTTGSTTIPKLWNGTAWVTFSAGAADFSDAATGTYTDSGISYKYITYTASGTLTVTKAGLADVLVISGAGGGGRDGGAESGGGGGAGGYLYQTVILDIATYGVTIGGGGAAGSGTSSGADGSRSRLGSLYTIAGGGGGGDNAVGRAGGSGGGGGDFFSNGGAGAAGQGNDGGNNQGGGGGAGAAGGSGGGAGGAGISNSITGSAVTYAAGGSADSTASGTANRGTGGGGHPTSPGAGGSGVVIVRVRT
jgi:hypothetical protein